MQDVVRVYITIKYSCGEHSWIESEEPLNTAAKYNEPYKPWKFLDHHFTSELHGKLNDSAFEDIIECIHSRPVSVAISSRKSPVVETFKLGSKSTWTVITSIVPKEKILQERKEAEEWRRQRQLELKKKEDEMEEKKLVREAGMDIEENFECELFYQEKDQEED